MKNLVKPDGSLDRFFWFLTTISIFLGLVCIWLSNAQVAYHNQNLEPDGYFFTIKEVSYLTVTSEQFTLSGEVKVAELPREYFLFTSTRINDSGVLPEFRERYINSKESRILVMYYPDSKIIESITIFHSPKK